MPPLLSAFVYAKASKILSVLVSAYMYSPLQGPIATINSHQPVCRSSEDVHKRAVLAMMVKTLAGLHGDGTVHGALSPSALV